MGSRAPLINISNALHKCGATRLSTNDAQYDSISFFPRHEMKNSLFFALELPDWNGFDYIPSAVANGALGVVVSSDQYTALKNIPPGTAVYRAENLFAVLESLAALFRTAFTGPVVAVTGSAGKTQSLLFLNEILGSKHKVQFNDGNRNNMLGICDLLCSLQSGTQILLAEIGARKQGEIQKIASVLKPDTALLTTIQHSHLKYLEDFNGVVKLKSEILKSSGLKNVCLTKESAQVITNLPEGLAYHFFDKIFVETNFSGRQLPMVLGGVACVAGILGMSSEELSKAFKNLSARAPHSMDLYTDKEGRYLLLDGRTNSFESVLNFIETLETVRKKADLAIISGTFDLGEANELEFVPQIAARLSQLEIKKIHYIGNFGDAFQTSYKNAGGSALVSLGNPDATEIESEIEKLKSGDFYALQGHMQPWLYQTMYKMTPVTPSNSKTIKIT